MFTRTIILACLLFIGAVTSAQAASPNFGEAIWGDGVLWGTKGNAALPTPNSHNKQSYDGLFIILNGVEGQKPVSEAAPGNPAYNGGRWITNQVMWLTEPELLTSYEDILYHEGENNLVIVEGTFPGGPPPYFQCPLLPVK